MSRLWCGNSDRVEHAVHAEVVPVIFLACAEDLGRVPGEGRRLALALEEGSSDGPVAARDLVKIDADDAFKERDYVTRGRTVEVQLVSTTLCSWRRDDRQVCVSRVH